MASLHRCKTMSKHLSFLLNDGTHIPWLGFGTGTALYGRDASNSVRVAIENGITLLDGAQWYSNEDSLGAGIKASGKKRSDLYILTKLKMLSEGDTVESMLRGSLKKLGVDYVDLFLIHSPLHFEGRRKEVWKDMEAVQKAGLAKSIGVSNFTTDHLEEILDCSSIVPAVNEIEFHPYVYKAATPVVELGKKHGILTASYGGLSPIARSGEGPLDPVLETICQRLENTRSSPVLASQVLMKWMNQQGIVVITTSSKEDRLKAALDAVNIPDLTPEEMNAIAEAGSKIHKRHYMRPVYGE